GSATSPPVSPTSAHRPTSRRSTSSSSTARAEFPQYSGRPSPRPVTPRLHSATGCSPNSILRTSPASTNSSARPPSSRQRATSSGRPEVREHRQHPPVVVRARRQPQLPEDARHVLLDGALGDDERVRDRLIRAPLRHQLEHLALARREVGDRVVAALAADELRDDR